jgi:hypothetical protein
MTWTPLRTFLEGEVAAWVDDLIAAEPDPRTRAALAFYRTRIIDGVADKAELQLMRRRLADADHDDAPPARLNGHSVNGHKIAH